MNIAKYLQRITFDGKIKADDQTLFDVHERHVFHVPFENIDIHYKQIFDLELESLYKKVVANGRGGFCYELNFIFNSLLNKLGFASKIISSRIFDASGNLGPEYDHMSIYVKTKKEYLVDVGYGDLFVRPIEIRNGIQHDGRNFFKIEKSTNEDFLLSMSGDASHFEKKYIFKTRETVIDSFKEICYDKQTNPSSYFVKNTICTKPVLNGRITLFNNKLIEKGVTGKKETAINDDNDFRDHLKQKFNIKIDHI
jgi:N-hydroxyarylamine O-acetyltransferase